MTHGGSARKTSATGFVTSDQPCGASSTNGAMPTVIGRKDRFRRTQSRPWDHRRRSTRRQPGSTLKRVVREPEPQASDKRESYAGA